MRRDRSVEARRLDTTRRLGARRAAAFAVTLAVALAPMGAHAVPIGGPGDPASYVDPFIGTLEGGFAFPGAAAPYGMVQNSPDTEGQFAYTGYQWGDQFIRGFSLVHVESMGVQEGGLLPFMPTTGAPSSDVKAYESKFHHASETATAGYYAVDLDTYGIRAELTAGTRAGMQRYTFPAGAQANVLIDAGRQIAGGGIDDWQTTPGTANGRVKILDDRTVLGGETPASDDRDFYQVFFAARFDKPFTAHGVWGSRGATPSPGDEVAGKGAGAYVSFDDPGSVTMKVGVSFVSPENALANLDAELPGEDFDFDALHARTRAAWNDALSAIQVTSPLDTEKTSFYTALYHAQHHPNVFNDANGEYLGYDGATHTVGADGVMPAGSTYYANFSLWDTYRAEMPLLEMIAPDRVRDMMRSLMAIADQGGRPPRWGLQNRYADYMIGEPVLQVLGDAFCRGLVPADVRDRLYEQARTLALESTRNDGPEFRSGWVHSGDGPSTTMEFASGHFALALVAHALGHNDDAAALLGNARHWSNVIDPDTRFARPRAANGEWGGTTLPNGRFVPEDSAGFKEGTAWQWTWLVPHDVRGLAAQIDEGAETQADTTRARLDQFFSTPAAATVPLAVGQAQTTATAFGIAYYGNQYAPSNEHDLQAPFLYDWLGEAWKSQALARQHQSLFRPTPDGLPGNDDLGTMSAWFVWSALGVYPVVPGAPLVMMGSPMFERATIRVPGGSFTIEAPGASLAAKYVQSATLDGQPLEKTYFGVSSIDAGDVLHVEMGAAPNTEWGSEPGAAPPSQTGSAIEDFGCST